MEQLSRELIQFLYSQGADLAGCSPLPFLKRELAYGAAVAVRVPEDVVLSIENGPTREYYDAYHALNSKLDQIVQAGADFLQKKGYTALAQTTSNVATIGEERTRLPHKTVARWCGLGWIGKNNLLVTKEYGGAVRLSSLVTNAPLVGENVILNSQCGSCQVCKTVCPAGAIYGEQWQLGKDRDEMFSMPACRQMGKQLTKHNFGIEIDICGRCFALCPYTQRYIKRAKPFPIPGEKEE